MKERAPGTGAASRPNLVSVDIAVYIEEVDHVDVIVK